MPDKPAVYPLTLKFMPENSILMKQIPLFILFILCTAAGTHAQFYYKDIISNRQLQDEMQRYREKKVRTVNIKSIDADGSDSEGFFCQKKLSKDYRKTELFTRSDLSAPSLFTSYFNEKGKLTETRDSSSLSLTINRFSYDGQDRLKSISSAISSSDDDFRTEIQEMHIYQYNDKNEPLSMTRVRNQTDSSTIYFSTDEHGNVSIEKDSRTGSKYYYYYDAQNRLTDIVHSNEYKEKLLPDYLFEYNNTGQLSQMISTEEGGSYYYIWKYAYDDGLRVKEKCFSKERKLLGTIEYEYK